MLSLDGKLAGDCFGSLVAVNRPLFEEESTVLWIVREESFLKAEWIVFGGLDLCFDGVYALNRSRSFQTISPATMVMRLRPRIGQL